MQLYQMQQVCASTVHIYEITLLMVFALTPNVVSCKIQSILMERKYQFLTSKSLPI